MDEPQKRILIVDDEPPLLKMMGVYLRRKGFNVETIDSTDRAWSAVESGAAELEVAVIDGSMRGLSAEELGLRILGTNPTACVVIASGYPVDMSRLESAGGARVAYMQKPFTAEALALTLRRMVAEKENL